MIALKIHDIKLFMSGLLLHTTFDEYLAKEVEIVTSCTFQIDGKVQKDWYSSDEIEMMNNRHYVKWSEIKQHAYQLIRGNKTPLSFRIIFMLSEENKKQFVQETGISFQSEDISGLFLNVRYDKEDLIIVTGSSLSIFSLDKSVDQQWDSYVKEIFSKCKIAYEEME